MHVSRGIHRAKVDQKRSVPNYWPASVVSMLREYVNRNGLTIQLFVISLSRFLKFSPELGQYINGSVVYFDEWVWVNTCFHFLVWFQLLNCECFLAFFSSMTVNWIQKPVQDVTEDFLNFWYFLDQTTNGLIKRVIKSGNNHDLQSEFSLRC